MVNKVAQLLKKESFGAFADQVIFSGGSFVVTILLARLLPPPVFGQFSILILLLYMLMSISNGIVISPFQVSRASLKPEGSYESFVFFLQLGFTVSLLSLGFLLAQFNVLPIDIENHLTGSLVLIAGFLFHDFIRKFLVAKGRTWMAFILDLITVFIQLGLILFMKWTNRHDLSATILFIGLSYLPSVLFTIFIIRPAFNQITLWTDFFQKHLTQGKWLVMTAAIQWLSNNLFVMASGAWLGTTALGALRLVQSLFGFLNMVLQAFENYGLPIAASLFRSSPDQARTYLRQLGVYGFMGASFILALLFIFSKWLIVLVGGSHYAPYDFVVKGMVILYAVLFAGYPFRMAIRMMVLNNLFFQGYVISCVFSLIAFQFLLQTWGLYGALAGLIINQLLMITYWQFCLQRRKFLIWK